MNSSPALLRIALQPARVSWDDGRGFLASCLSPPFLSLLERGSSGEGERERASDLTLEECFFSGAKSPLPSRLLLHLAEKWPSFTAEEAP